MKYRVTSHERVIMMNTYSVEADSKEAAEEKCVCGDISVTELHSDLVATEHWLETVSVDADYPGGQLPVSFFEELPQGTVLRLYYNCFNTGDFLWRHEGVDEEGAIIGSFKYDDDDWIGPDVGYVNSFAGIACRSSGAEPLHAHPPMKADDPL